MVAVDAGTDTERTPIWLQDAVVSVRALDALAGVGVLELLAVSPRTTGELLAGSNLARRPLDLALDVACHAGVVARDDDGRWSMPDPAARFMLLDQGEVAELLRGAPPQFDAGNAMHSADRYPQVVARIGSMVDPFRGPIVDALTSPGQHVLEIGAGASPWGRALCGADPTTTVTAVDLPDVIDTTAHIVGEAGLTDRYRFVGADVFGGVDPGPADLVVVAGLCRLVGAARNAALFRDVAGWCSAEGRVGVVDAVATAEAREAGLSRYELSLLTRTTEGRCWTLDHYARWLTEAGLGDVELVSTARAELSLVLARKATTT